MGNVVKTTHPPTEVGRIVIVNRETGEPVREEGAPIHAIDIPFERPHPAVQVWRYLDWFKFEDLVVKRRLYFCRADRLDDQMEGRFSEANYISQTALWQRFHHAHGIQQNSEQERGINESLRHRVFISCWHVNTVESARMWELYTKSTDSVVIYSRCGLLDSSTDGRAYQPLVVRYASQEVPRPEYHSLAPFVFKDTTFSFENEVRLISVGGLEEEAEVHRTLPIRPDELILKVYTNPAASRRFRRRVEALCRKHLSFLRPNRSSLDARIASSRS